MNRWILGLMAAWLFASLQVFAGEAVKIGERHPLKSAVLNEERSYAVALPKSYTPQGSRRYTVLYVLDAQTAFKHVATTVEFLSDYGDIPEMIVVGIDSTDRLRDYTPTDWSKMNGADGGGPTFKRFLAQELIPEIERNYRSDGYRILMGHSLAGLFTLYAMTDEPTLFRAWLVTSPTLDWDDGYALRAFKPDFGKAIKQPGFLYLARSDDSGKPLADFDAVVAAVKKHAPDTLRSHASAYPDEMHVTVPLVADIDALRQLYAGYRLHPDHMDKGIAHAEQHFAVISKKLGTELAMPEQTANELGYAALGAERVDEATALFERNVRNFPDSANAADSLADAYAKAERWAEARDSAARAVAIATRQRDPNLAYFQKQVQQFTDAAAKATAPNQAD